MIRKVRTCNLMKRYIKSSVSWNDLTSSEQIAVEYAKDYLDAGFNVYDAAWKGCRCVSEGNSEPEYTDEDFYMDEPDEHKVQLYLLSTYNRELV